MSIDGERERDRHHTTERLQTLAWTLVGITAVAGVVLIVQLGIEANLTNARKARDIRIAKVEVCRTIGDEAIRAFCVVNGGAGER